MSDGLVIVVTGANGGVGFGICHRLLVQLSTPNPPDARPYFKLDVQDPSYAHNAARDIANEYVFSPDASVTIVMACRDTTRAQSARTKLYGLLDKHIAKLRRGSEEHLYACRFRQNLSLELETLDLASIDSIFTFGKTVSRKYPYVSHLICNAGTATFGPFNIFQFISDISLHTLHTIHYPRYTSQVNGVMTKDNLGYTWQCNIFGHYILYRSVQPLLLAYAKACKRSARVLWTSSLTSAPAFDPDSDWQLTKTLHSYEASKYQTELICSSLEKRVLEAQDAGRASSLPELVGPHGEIHHLTISPGITATAISLLPLNNIHIPGLQYVIVFAFFLVRLLGSQHLLLSLYASAVSCVHVALVPLRALPTARTTPVLATDEAKYPSWHLYHEYGPQPVQMLRFGSESDWWGNERTGVMAIPVWKEHPNAGEVLLERFERLYTAFRTAKEERP